jgi:hypothetical protein
MIKNFDLYRLIEATKNILFVTLYQLNCVWFNGVLPFISRLFEEHEELLLLFEKFRELKTKEQQATSEELAEHANKVMETIDEGIRSLDELDVFFQYLHDIGASHTRIPGKINFTSFSNWRWILSWTNSLYRCQKIVLMTAIKCFIFCSRFHIRTFLGKTIW